MPVTGTYCPLCAMPVQHDHYVPTANAQMFKIYRSGSFTATPVEFSPSHEWLKRAVALPITADEETSVVEGSVEDGGLTTREGEVLLVGDGTEDFAAMHKVCWELSGSPASYDDFFAPVSHESILLQGYQQQLFDFPALQRDGKSWMMADPQSNTPEGKRNQERLQKLIAASREFKVVFQNVVPKSAKDVLRLNAWGSAPTASGCWRFRRYISPDIDNSGFTHLAWIQLPVTNSDDAFGSQLPQAIDDFEEKLISEFDAKEAGALLACIVNRGAIWFIHYLNEAHADSKKIQELCRETTGSECQVSISEDPKWETYFGDIYPKLPK